MDVSVVMTALDEPYVNKTIDDIIEKTGRRLKEIIVIDDNSKEPVSHPEAKVIRNDRRRGLIWGRNHGTEIAKSDMIISIDPHCSVTKGWMAPMMNRLSQDYNCVVAPKTWQLNPETWTTGNRRNVGRATNWKWNLEFRWNNKAGGKITPAVCGHCFAFTKAWWEESGRFDNEMRTWGGENIEFTLRTWLFGGSVELVNCFVSHWFKKKFQYTFPDGHLRFNKCRVAEVWFDGYVNKFYDAIKQTRGSIDFGDIRDRLRIKAKKQVRSMDWFIDNIQPHLRDE